MMDLRLADTRHGRGLPSTGSHRVAGLTVGILMVLGALMGSVNLFVPGALVDGPRRWLYAATMGLLALVSLPFLVRRRAGRAQIFALVVLGDLIYVVVALSVTDPLMHASPLMLLFTSFVAAWFLGRRELAVNLVLTPVACLVALWSSFESPAALAIQVFVSAGMLDAVALSVFLLRRREERLLEATQALSNKDPLTGLSNRRYLEEQAPRVFGQARRDGTRVVAMVLDLDHFKQLNDAHGHAAGDAVLRTVAGSLAATVRPADVLARTGGEELVVLGLVGDHAEAAHLAERLRTAVATSRTADGHAVTASVGVALTRPVDGADLREALWRLIDRADAAMYQAKQLGRDRVAALPVPVSGPRPVAGPPAPEPAPEPASDVA